MKPANESPVFPKRIARRLFRLSLSNTRSILLRSLHKAAPHDGADAFGRQGQGGDEEPGLPLDGAARLAVAVDDDDAVQARPGVTPSEPCDIVDDGGGPGLDAAVMAIDGLVAADRGVLEAHGFLLGHEEIDIGAERALVALQGEEVIGLLVEDFLDDAALAAHRVAGDDSASTAASSSKSEDHGRFSTSSHRHALTHPIALRHGPENLDSGFGRVQHCPLQGWPDSE